MSFSANMNFGKKKILFLIIKIPGVELIFLI